MNQLITVTFDGKVFKPETPLDLEINRKYQIQLIPTTSKSIVTQDSEEQKSIRNHQSFLNGYAPEDEGLYDDY
jgi:predicted DNA-binding antitoxin AbrB/MazE fold protein